MVTISVGSTEAIIDEDDLCICAKYSWYLDNRDNVQYAYTFFKGKKLYMHKLIYNLYKEIHHLNGNGLDNRKSNLQTITRSNHVAAHGLRSTNTSGYKGVTYNKDRKKWQSQLHKNGRCYHLGLFDSRQKAALIRDLWALEIFGVTTYTNHIVISFG